MAEALGAVGTAASLIQLADASIRTCFCLYAFFSSLHNAHPEFERHIIVIRDVHDAIQLVRKTTNSHGLTQADKNMLSGQLNSVTHELSTLQKATAGKDPTKLKVKLTWVRKMAETDRVLQRLENHKTSLILLLQALQLGQSGQILHSQVSHQACLRDLQALVEQQSREHVTLRSDHGSGLADLSAKMDSNLRLYQESLEKGFSTLTRDHEVMVSEEHLGNVFRHVLDSHILSRVEESLSTRSELQNAATIQQFRAIMTDATNQILQHIDKSTSTSKPPKIPAMPMEEEPTTFGSASSYVGSQDLTVSSPERHQRVVHTSTQSAHDPSACHSHKVTEWSYWASIPHIGTVRVKYRIHSAPSGRFYIFKIDFWPTIILLDRKCISLKYSSRRDQQGYMALCPLLAIHPILPHDDIIWSMIANDDIDGATARFQQKKNGPFDQDSHGISLLMDALDRGSYRIAQLLIQQGADPTQTTACGRDALNALVRNELHSVVVGPQLNCPCCHKHIRPDFSLFFTTFHSLLAAGCDLEDCQVTIFEFIMNERLVRDLSECDDDDDLIQLLSYETASEESMSDSYSERSEDSIIGKISGDTVTGSSPIHHDRAAEVEAFDGDPYEAYLSAISQLAQFLGRQGLDLLRETPGSFRLIDAILEPHKMTLSVLQTCGLTSNYEGAFHNNMRPVIYDALYSILLRSNKNSNLGVLMNNLVALIRNGADIYHVEWASDDWIDDVDDDGLMSPTAYVKANDLMPVWKYALKAAGYDSEQVLLEDERRRRKFRQLQGASSSSVEVAEENPGSSIRRREI